ncbi:alpha/beta fold hydrolase [Clostridium sp.]|uniref:alpha/beta fold hydrolase n=1 Tax=Clostridium sp. TaxID=1506 RepID=UPI003D6C9B7D
MNFKVFGDINNKAIILIHGAFVSWKMWSEQIEAFTPDFFVIVPLLDGHDIEKKSTFTTIQNAASDIAFWYGEKEKRLLGKSVKQLSKLLPSSQIQEFKRLGHGDLVSKNPDIFNKKACAFLGTSSNYKCSPL